MMVQTVVTVAFYLNVVSATGHAFVKMVDLGVMVIDQTFTGILLEQNSVSLVIDCVCISRSFNIILHSLLLDLFAACSSMSRVP